MVLTHHVWYIKCQPPKQLRGGIWEAGVSASCFLLPLLCLITWLLACLLTRLLEPAAAVLFQNKAEGIPTGAGRGAASDRRLSVFLLRKRSSHQSPPLASLTPPHLTSPHLIPNHDRPSSPPGLWSLDQADRPNSGFLPPAARESVLRA